MSHCFSLQVRWRRFIGKLSPTHALLFQLLLVTLVAVNVAGIVITAQRLKHSYAFPISVMTVKRFDLPPAFTVAWWPPYYSPNASLTCSSNVYDPSAGACPQGTLSVDPHRSTINVIAASSNDGPGDAQFTMFLQAMDVQPGDCITVQLLGVPLDSITAESFDDLSSSAPLSSTFTFCPPAQPGSSFQQYAYPAFSALEDVHGRVNYSISVNTDAGVSRPAGLRTSLILDIKTGGGMPVVWETQEYSYTYIDFLSSIFAVFNISLTVLAFLFPWRYVGELQSRGREFRLACDGKKSNVTADDDDDTDVESNASSSRQLQERMLPYASIASLSPQGEDRSMSERALSHSMQAAVEQLVARMLVDRDQRAAAALHSGSQGQ